MMVKIVVFVSILLFYLSAFFIQELQIQYVPPHLTPTLPARVHKIAAGYMYQLWAEMLYIKTIVFLGGRKPGQEHQSYAENLAEHFSVISTLHPDFIDTYFMCESSLSSLGSDCAQKTNAVLERGIAANPGNWILPFFKGFNYFRYLDEPKKAAETLYKASQITDAPVWLGHLASILSAQGGDIYAGLIWLKAMLATEKDERIQELYKKEIIVFENAVRVLQAVQKYSELFNRPPNKLNDLVPDFIPEIPKIEQGFALSWKPPVLRLIRPHAEF